MSDSIPIYFCPTCRHRRHIYGADSDQPCPNCTENKKIMNIHPLNLLDEQIFSHETCSKLPTGELNFEFINPTFKYSIHPDIKRGIKLKDWRCLWRHDYSLLEVIKPNYQRIIFRLKIFANYDEQLTQQVNKK